MKKLIQRMTDIESGVKKPLNESIVDECGDMPGSPMMPQQSQPQGNPVTISVNFNASGAENVAELMNILKNSGMQAGPGASAPTEPMRMDMEKFRGIVDAGDEGEDDDMEMKFGMDDDNDDIKGMSKSESADWSNAPEEEYKDHNFMTKELSGGINGPKKMYKPAAKGDNPMAAESIDITAASIKSRLLQALSEKKNPKNSKPDFLDVDKDGDKKEPFKKAAKDAKSGKDDKDSKPKKGEVPPQFAKKKVDEVSNKTLKSYAKAASGSSHPSSASNLSSKAAYALGKSADDDYTAGERDDKKSATRSKYVGKAIDRISKEATIHKDFSDNPTPLPNKRAYDLEKAGETKKKVSLSKAPWDKKEVETKEASTGDYSAKKAAAGKDIGKPGKQFAKIAKTAGEKYGSKERGEKVAGAVLAKLRKK